MYCNFIELMELKTALEKECGEALDSIGTDDGERFVKFVEGGATFNALGKEIRIPFNADCYEMFTSFLSDLAEYYADEGYAFIFSADAVYTGGGIFLYKGLMDVDGKMYQFTSSDSSHQIDVYNSECTWEEAKDTSWNDEHCVFSIKSKELFKEILQKVAELLPHFESDMSIRIEKLG